MIIPYPKPKLKVLFGSFSFNLWYLILRFCFSVFSYIPVNTATSGCQTTFVPEEFFAGAPLLAHTPDKGSRDQVQKRLSYSDSLTPSEDCLLCTSPSCNLFWSPVFSDVSPTTLDTPPLRPVAHRYSSTTPTDILSAVSDINDDFPTTQYIDVSDEETTQLATPSRSPGSAFTTLDWQENELRHVFKKRAYLSAAEKAKLAKRLGITVENVQVNINILINKRYIYRFKDPM